MKLHQSGPKAHQDQSYLQTKINEGYTSKEIANQLRVSYKLVEIYLRKFGIKHVSHAA
jgi:DNA-binding CsgD family transcriptional regulator